jgi:hypothetical protein
MRDRETEKQRDWKKERETERQKERKKDRETETERQGNRETERQKALDGHLWHGTPVVSGSSKFVRKFTQTLTNP